MMATGKMSLLLLLPWVACLSVFVLYVSGQEESIAGEEGLASPGQDADPEIPQDSLSYSVPTLEMDTAGEFHLNGPLANGLLRIWDSNQNVYRLINLRSVSGNGQRASTLLFCAPRPGLPPLCINRPEPGDPARSWDRPGQRSRRTHTTATGGGLSLNCNYTSPDPSFRCTYKYLLQKVLRTMMTSGTHARFVMSLYRVQDGQVCKIMSTTPACVTSANHFVMFTRTLPYVNEYENIKNAYRRRQVPAGGVCSSYTGSQTASILSFDLVAGTCPPWNGNLAMDPSSFPTPSTYVCLPATVECDRSFLSLGPERENDFSAP